MTAPNLLWLTEHHPPSRGGMAHSCDRIVAQLRARGARVDLCHLHPRPERPGVAPFEAQRREGGCYRHCPPSPDPAHALNLLWAHLERDGAAQPYTHVLAFGGSLPLLAGPVFSAWLGAPLITLLRGNDLDLGVFSPRRRGTLGEAVQASAAVAVVSQEMARKVRSLWGDVPTRWIPNGIDLERWRPLPSEAEAARRWREERAPGQQVVGMIGHLKAKKGADLLLWAAEAAAPPGRLHALLVGEATPEVEERLAAAGERLPHTRVPPTDRYGLIRWYLACDWIALPSHYDGMPNALLEAASLGIPLIASTAGGLGDVLVDGLHGYTFPPGDRHGLRLALDRALAASTEERQRMGAAARALAAELSAAREADAYLALLREARRGADLVPWTGPRRAAGDPR